MELAEQNRLRIEEFWKELTRQMLTKKDMYEEAREEEMRKLRLERETEDERKKILSEEHRKLVVNHTTTIGPEVIKYFPKGALRLEDLDYLPEEYRYTILQSRELEKV
jgi:hypothetical protein